MIIKFDKYNESIKSLLIGPTKEDVWDNLFKDKLNGLITSIPDSPEDFFNQMKDDCSKMYESEYIIYWGKNGIRLFRHELKNGILWISYIYIWLVLEKIYGFDYDETKSFIRKQLLEDVNWKGLIPLKDVGTLLTL